MARKLIREIEKTQLIYRAKTGSYTKTRDLRGLTISLTVKPLI